MEKQNPEPDTAPDIDAVSVEEKTEALKQACGHTSDHQELDTSQGDFTTIAIGIIMALAVYVVIPAVTGIRLGDYPTVIIYCGFLVLVLIFWFAAEKIKNWRRKNHQ